MTRKGRMLKAAGLGWLVSLVLIATAWAQAAQRTFPTPEAAAAALLKAVRFHDKAELAGIVGPAFAAMVAGEGAEANASDRERFLAAAGQATVLRPEGADLRILEVGLAAWPLPAPLVRAGDAWRFDGEAGVEAAKDRIVGRNELEAIGVMRAYVDAQAAYAAQIRDGSGVRKYAQRLASTPGNHDGLYWPVVGNDEPSPFGPFLGVAGVHPENRDPATPYYGYFYRILTRQGPNAPGGAYDYVINGNMIAGFALVAWPAVYGESGVMTFLVNQSGIVLQGDLASNTGEIGPKMLTYNPGGDWLPVED